MTSDCFQDKPFNITVIQVCVPTTDCKETAVDRFYENLQHLLELKPKKKKKKKDVLFNIEDLNAKVEKRYLE